MEYMESKMQDMLEASMAEDAESETPELDRLKQHFQDDGVTGFHASWGDEVYSMTPEQQARIINASIDEIQHPVLGLAASMDGEAVLFEDSAHPRYNLTTKQYDPLTPQQKRDQRTADLLKQGAEMMRKLYEEMNP